MPILSRVKIGDTAAEPRFLPNFYSPLPLSAAMEYNWRMDFFQHQGRAKHRTCLLVCLYTLGLFGLTAVVAVAVFIAMDDSDPALPLLCAGGVFVLVLGGSLFKTAQLSAGGGRSVAESLGGRQVSHATTDPAERRLYNVVEEMALAAGVPVPTLYMIDNERSINAFAAGFSPNAAVIGVNRGTVELLTRDELQGVIAHEFSHILNGDMRMNLRLIGILFGLQLLAIIGYYAMRVVRYVPANRNNKGGGAIILVIIICGLALMIIGYIGVFFSALIRAAISRQREFLADASAVQFTRNPDGIAGALKKIGCPNVGSNVSSARAAEASHLFFGNVCGLFSFGALFATHPELTTRIKRIDPHFDGRFPDVLVAEKPMKYADKPHRSNILPTIGTKQSVMEHIGELNIANVLAAGALLQAIPKNVTESASNPLSAQAVFFALLLDSDESIRNRQLNQIQFSGSSFLMNESQRLYPQICSLPEEEKIPLVQYVSASLREMTGQQYRKFTKVFDLLIAADNKMNLFEYTLKAMLLRDLDIHFGLAQQLRVRHTSLSSVCPPIVAVLSHLAYSGHDSHQEVLGAFSAAMEELGLSNPILLPNEISVQRFDQSLRTLAETSPAIKKQIFAAFMTCVWYDKKITPQEAGLIRAIAAMLAIPIPVLT